MKKICHRTLFETTVHNPIPIGDSGYLVTLPCSSLDGTLEIPSHWQLHNYLLYKNIGHEGYRAYVGETSGRLSRVLEDKAGTKNCALGRALLFFSTDGLSGPVLRNALEARLCYVLRRQTGWRFSNSSARLSVWQHLESQHDKYVDTCVETACTYLRSEGVLQATEEPNDLRFGRTQNRFEMVISHEGKEFYADAVINAHNRLMVLAGSCAPKRPRRRHDDHGPLRKSLIRKGILQASSPFLYRFARSFEFDHPTTAAGVIAGQNVSGLHTWRERGTGRPIGYCDLPDNLRGRWPSKRA